MIENNLFASKTTPKKTVTNKAKKNNAEVKKTTKTEQTNNKNENISELNKHSKENIKFVFEKGLTNIFTGMKESGLKLKVHSKSGKSREILNCTKGNIEGRYKVEIKDVNGEIVKGGIIINKNGEAKLTFKNKNGENLTSPIQSIGTEPLKISKPKAKVSNPKREVAKTKEKIITNNKEVVEAYSPTKAQQETIKKFNKNLIEGKSIANTPDGITSKGVMDGNGNLYKLVTISEKNIYSTKLIKIRPDGKPNTIGRIKNVEVENPLTSLNHKSGSNSDVRNVQKLLSSLKNNPNKNPIIETKNARKEVRDKYEIKQSKERVKVATTPSNKKVEKQPQYETVTQTGTAEQLLQDVLAKKPSPENPVLVKVTIERFKNVSGEKPGTNPPQKIIQEKELLITKVRPDENGNIVGMNFNPDKSGPVQTNTDKNRNIKGLEILENGEVVLRFPNKELSQQRAKKIQEWRIKNITPVEQKAPYIPGKVANIADKHNKGSEQVQPPNIEIKEALKALKALKDVKFFHNRATLTEDAKGIIEKHAATLIKYFNTYPNKFIMIAGHTDATGTSEYNLGLSIQRAESVFKELVSKGINKKNIKPIGFGEKYLIKDTQGESKTNRRTEFVLSDNIPKEDLQEYYKNNNKKYFNYEK